VKTTFLAISEKGKCISYKNIDVRGLVEDCLLLRGFDRENYGTDNWNPLGDIIIPGQNVVIKPNLVNDHHHGKKDKTDYGLDCLITNVSVTKVICDYCLKALHGEGKVTVCDAPIQDCVMENLLERSGYGAMIEDYQKAGKPVCFEDLRLEQRIVNRFAVKTKTRILNAEHVYVQMNDNTAFSDLKGEYEYNVLNYDKEITKEHHRGGRHEYSISKTVLEADVIINLCKPKTHRYAGLTAAMKNAVGMVAEKETLPHRRIGEVSQGGDSYNGSSKIKRRIDIVLDRQVKAENKGQTVRATCCRFEYGFLYYLSKLKGEDSSLKGCWHGNDTIWRTIWDLNYIIRHADKSGILHEDVQRTIINVGDMIIAGEHNGPLSPDDKPLGMILLSDDEIAFDLTVCKIMGFSPRKMPLYRYILDEKKWNDDIVLKSNDDRYSGKLEELRLDDSWKFVPHDAWKEKIEAGDDKREW
jgi:uncharacterized protein (DUF362 family)